MLDLEKDPTPGDPQRVRKLAKDLHDFADDVGKVLRDIKGMAGEDAILQWAGQTAEAFTEKFEDAPGKLKKLKKSYDMAGDALAAYWPELERAQTLADKALVKGREAQADLSSAKSRLSSADSWVDKAGKEADKYKDDGGKGKDVPKPDPDKVRAATRNAASAEKAQKSAQGDVDSAKSALDAAKKMAEDARKMREEAAGTAKRKIDEASDAGIQNRKWWEEIGDWVSDNWDTIVAVCKVVVAVVGVIAMIIGGPILAAIVIVAGAIVLADTLSKYAKGQATLMDVAFAAMDCIPGGKGITTAAKLGKGLKGLKGGLKGFKSARTALKGGAKGAYNRVKSKIKGCGDPVDVATGQMFLAETDVTLPGTLPLVFTRRVASGYRSGGWFGPTWCSTLDQRLEVDDEGIVFVTEDGMLLTYPHPTGPDAPVLPEFGPLRPLERLDSGGYRVTDPATGHHRHFAPPVDDVALLTRICDRNGNSIDIDTDAEGTPQGLRHCGGYHLKLTIEDERVTALSLADAAEDGSDVVIKRYGYTDGNLTEVTNSSGLPMQFTYDDQLRITAWEDTNHSRYHYVYDDQDRCIAQGGEDGQLANTFTYDLADPAWPGCRMTDATTSAGATSRYVVNQACLVVAEIDPLGNTIRYQHDCRDRLLAETDPLGNTTCYHYDDAGSLRSITRPDGRSSHAEYNELGLPVKVVKPDGAVWLQTYDERGNRTAVTNPVGRVTRFTYSAQGHLMSVTNANGDSSVVRCDRAGLPVEVTSSLGSSTRYERDTFGRPVRTTNALGHTARMEWTVEGRLARRMISDGHEESWMYDGEGNCLEHTDRMGAHSRYEYTHFDRLSARISADGARHEFTYDAELRLTRVTNPQGLAWEYDYDPAGRLTAETDFDDRTLRYGYDGAGRLISRTNALGEVVCFERDVLGRITRKDAAGHVTTFTYTPGGQLTEAVGPDSALAMHYDRAGLLLTESVNGRELSFAYDELGRRIRRTTPAGATSAWSYDAVGHPTQLTTAGHSITFEYDPAGRELARHLGPGATLAQTFDDLGRLTAQSVTLDGERTVKSRAYTYQADGNLVGLYDSHLGSRRFGLDAVGRVTSVQGADWAETYAYDATGNQTDASWPSGHPGQEATGSRDCIGTRIIRAGNVRYAYDAQGRIVLRQKIRLSRKPDTWRYTWDAEDHLTTVQTPDGTVWRYQYDPLGRRTAKQRLAADGSTVVEQIQFTWDGTTLCEQRSTGAELPNPVSVTWDHRGLHPVAQTERIATAEAPQEVIDSRFFAIVTDLVGTPTELVDERGDLAWRSRSTLWGATAWTADSTTYTPLRFPGQYFDPETELHYNYFRHYDPQTARYLTPDPLGLGPAPHPSTYVRNPHRWVDPLGLAPGSCGDGDGFLYRGVPTGHPMYDDALQGRAVPRGGHSDPGRHAGGNTDSEYTSWTHDYEDVALDAAEELGPGGLVMRIPESEVPASRNIQIHDTDHEVYEESEHALEGIVDGAEISIDRGPWTRP
ncbi:DUF6531 domain-containing protein [Streptomyces sp. NPDC041068]|uniref:DUF6531 domain-containing protein n=1 Tax=Streptomyces sp. NPDC041068 TaxID=3155130 RepID=UPI0033C152B5